MASTFLSYATSFRRDFLSGLTVALALVPEAVAFAFVAGVEPLVGLYAAFMVGFVTGIFGGRPGMISGATGALAVVMVSLISQHGIEYLFAAVVLMGIIQMIAGILQLGKFVRLIPHSVMLGAVNGLAIVIFISQLSQFKYIDSGGGAQWLTGAALWIMLALVVGTMVLIYLSGRLTKVVPASLVGIVVITLLIKLFAIDTRSVGDMASIAGGFPRFHIPMVPFTWSSFTIIFPYSCIFAAIGLTESLLTLQLVDEVTKTRGRGNKECIAQGLANVATGFFGGDGRLCYDWAEYD